MFSIHLLVIKHSTIKEVEPVNHEFDAWERKKNEENKSQAISALIAPDEANKLVESSSPQDCVPFTLPPMPPMMGRQLSFEATDEPFESSISRENDINGNV